MALTASVRNGPTMALTKEYDHVNVKRLTLGAPDAAGERSETWANVEADVKADIQPTTTISGNDMGQIMPGLVALSSHVVFFEPGVDVLPADRIEDIDGNLYTVDAVKDWDSHITVAMSISDKA